MKPHPTRAGQTRARGSAALGTAGSLLMLLGSLGVGWLGPESPIRSWPLIASIRSDEVAVAACTGSLLVGGVLLLVAWLRLRHVARSGRADALRVVVRCAVLWSLPLTICVPLFSRDLYAYVGQGRLVAAGIDPYTTGVAMLPGWFGIGVDPLWANTPSPYGPLALALERTAVGVAGWDSPDLAAAILRAASVAGFVAAGWFALALARRRGLELAPVAWLTIASPLLIVNLVAAGHNDGIMLGLVLAGLYCADTRRPIGAVVLVAAAIAVKPIALLALPVVGIAILRDDASLRSRIRSWVVCTVAALVVVGGIGAAIGVGFGWVAATLTSPGVVEHWYAPTTVLVIAGEITTALLGLPEGIARAVVKAAALLAAGAGVTALMLTRRMLHPVTRVGAAFALVILASTAIHPWYVLWLVVFAAVAGFRSERWRRAAVLASIAFTGVCLAEPLDVVDEELAGMLRVLLVALTAAACVALSADYLREERLRFRDAASAGASVAPQPTSSADRAVPIRPARPSNASTGR